ncbi:MAG: Holliday junction branch migration protein RuvA [Victivallales bacterium]|nr:Holliday junction branch migration protein RuvA [Victivallales bacterium]
MIARIKGVLLEAEFTAIVVDVHGVGYLLSIPISTFDRLPQPGGEVELFVITHVREDAIALFGFATREEKQLFELLTNVNGIGPRLALNILSSLPVASFCSAVTNSDLKTLSRISGVGKKTAERLVVELRDKLAKMALGGTVAAPAATAPDHIRAAAEDAILALEQLGFRREGIQKTMEQLLEALEPQECSAENLIRKALQQLNR